MTVTIENALARIYVSEKSDGPIAGTGFLVSERWIITCAHVIQSALGTKAFDATSVKYVYLDFPLLKEQSKSSLPLKGKICFWQDPDGDDIAGIQLMDSLPPGAAPVRMLDIEDIELKDHSFSTFGFPRVMDDRGGWVGGKIIGGQADGHVQLVKSKAQGLFITKGFSGGPIWDKNLNGVVGMTAAFLGTNNPDTAFMIPTTTILEKWSDLRELPTVIRGWSHSDLVIQGYSQELVDEYKEYWKKYVSAAKSGQPEGELFHPVGQTFQSVLTVTRVKTSESQGKEKQQTTIADPGTEKRPEPAVKLEKEENVVLYSSLSSICNTLFDATGRNFIVLTGEPGSGKTLSLHHFMAEQALKIQDTSGAIPIYIPLHRFLEGVRLDELIRQTLRSHGKLNYHQRLAGSFEKIIAGREVILLLDGVNEIPKSSIKASVYKQLLAQIDIFSKQYRVKGILATREGDFSRETSYPKVSIRPFEQLGIEEALTLFIPQYAAELQQILKKEPALQELAANPFRLKALCQIYHPGMHIPRTPSALYQSFIDLLEKREQQKQNKTRSLAGWSKALSRFAFELTERSTTSMSSQEASSYLRANISSFGESIGVLRHTPDSVSFVHQQLQEYFAAQYLAREIQSSKSHKKLFASLALKTSWDEPFILLTDILQGDLLDNVIGILIENDIFLAAKCVGRNPNKVRLAARARLVKDLEQLVRISLDRRHSDILAQATAALGASRIEEALAVLAKPDLEGEIYVREGSAYLNAIAQIDTPAAVRLITQNLSRRITRRDQINQDELWSFIFALASMKTSVALEFLVDNVQNPVLYPYIIRAFSEIRSPGFLPAYSDLLHGTRISKNDVSDKAFENLCRIASQAGMVQLVPDLLQYTQDMNAAEALVQLNAGQQIIDDLTGLLRYYVHFLDRTKDLNVFELSSGADSAMVWAILLQHHGQQAADNYINLLLHCAQNAPKASEKKDALLQLALLDVRKTLSVLQNASSRGTVTEHENNESPLDAALQRKLIRLFETPNNFGISRRPLEKIAVQLQNSESKAIYLTKGVRSQSSILDASDNSSVIREAIHKVIKQRASTSSPYSSDFYEILDALNDQDLLPILIHDLLLTLNSDYREDGRLVAAINGLIRYGQKEPARRREVISEMGALVQHTDRSIQIAAIEVLAELEASDHCDLLLDYLSDRTWQLAYVIVDLIDRMKPDADFANKVAERLVSPVPGQKYFALLALGSLKRVEFIPAILQHWRDSNEFVERAGMWALAEIGSAEFNVTDAISNGLDSPSGWVRLEAARSAGLLGLREFVNKLILLLSDPDLRVVEQAANALGHLQDPRALPALLLALKKSPVRELTSENVWRAEDRLQITLAASCVACNTGTADNDFDLGFRGEEKTLVTSILSGEMNRKRSINETVSTPSVHKTVRGTSRIPHESYRELSSAELKQIVLLAPDPEQRKAALEVMKGRGIKEPDEIRYDPNPAVRMDYHITSNKETGFNHRLPGTPLFSLGIAEAIKVEKPSAVLKIANKWESIYESSNTAALIVAKYFPERYRIKELSEILLDLNEKTTLSPDGAELLASILDKNHLAKFIRANRRRGWLFSYFSSHHLNAIDALVQRRTWSLVQDLTASLDSGLSNSRESRGFFLAALGIYQACDLMDSVNKSLGEDVLASHIVQAELQGIVPEPVRDSGGYYFSNHIYYGKFPVVLANLCCELNDPDAVQTWSKIASYRPSDADMEWITRGLRKWGLKAVYFLIQNYGERSPDAVIRICRVLRGDYKESKEYFSREFPDSDQQLIEQLVDAEDDRTFQEWLGHTTPAVQLFGLAALMRRKSSVIDEELINILKSMPGFIPFLIEYAEAGNLPALITSIHDLTGSRKTVLSPLSEAVFTLVKEQLQSTDKNILDILITLIGKFQLRLFSKTLVHMLEQECEDVNLLKNIIRALGALGNKSFGKTILPYLDSKDDDIVMAAFQALLALDYPIKPGRLEKLMKHSRHKIRGVAYVICGMRKIDSLGDFLFQSHLDLVNIHTAHLAKKDDKQVDQTISDDFPAQNFDPNWSAETLEYLISSSSLGLYLLGRLDHYHFFRGFQAHRESGLFSFMLLSVLFTEDIFYFGKWADSGHEYEWLEFCNSRLIKKTIEREIAQLPWLKTKEKRFFIGLFENTLPDLYQMFDRDSQKTMRQKQRDELFAFATNHRYTIHSLAVLIDKAADLASRESLTILKAISRVNNPKEAAVHWKKSIGAIRSEEDLKQIPWETIEAGVYLWLLNMVDPEASLFDESQQFWEFISLLTLTENQDWGSDEMETLIRNLIESNAAQRLKLVIGAQKIQNFCYTREMIHLLGIQLLDILSDANKEASDLSEARRWIKRWSRSMASMRSSTLEKISQKLEDGQKENPFEYVYVRPNKHRRAAVSEA